MGKKQTLKVLDLFSGAGGMALGFEAAGARCIGALEKDASAARTFAQMFAHSQPVVMGGPLEGDAHRLTARQMADRLQEVPDIIVGGPPCQGFSRAGRAKNKSLEGVELLHPKFSTRDPERNDLYRTVLDAVRFFSPLAFVIENVPGIREQYGVDRAAGIRREGVALGYNVRCFLLNAAWYGVPQHRWRLFIVGLRRDLGAKAIPQPPPRTHGDHCRLPEGMSIPREDWMVWGEGVPRQQGTHHQAFTSVHEALHDLPRLKGHLKGIKPIEQPLPYNREPSAWATLMKAWPGKEATNVVSGNIYRFTPRDFPIFKRMAFGDKYPQALLIAHEIFRDKLQKQGQVLEPGSVAWQALRAETIPPYRNDAFAEKWRKFDPDMPSWTVTAHLCRDTYSHIHYHSAQARTVTVREAARLQSFPDGFLFPPNMGDAFRQIGNAVPPFLGRAIALQLLKQIDLSRF